MATARTMLLDSIIVFFASASIVCSRPWSSNCQHAGEGVGARRCSMKPPRDLIAVLSSNFLKWTESG